MESDIGIEHWDHPCGEHPHGLGENTKSISFIFYNYDKEN